MLTFHEDVRLTIQIHPYTDTRWMDSDYFQRVLVGWLRKHSSADFATSLDMFRLSLSVDGHEQVKNNRLRCGVSYIKSLKDLRRFVSTEYLGEKYPNFFEFGTPILLPYTQTYLVTWWGSPSRIYKLWAFNGDWVGRLRRYHNVTLYNAINKIPEVWRDDDAY